MSETQPSPSQSARRAPWHTKAGFLQLQRSLDFRNQRARHSICLLPPRYRTDILPGLRRLQNYWFRRGLPL